MKRIVALFLALMMLFALVSCGEETKITKEKEEASTDRMTGEELYETAVKNTQNCPAVRFNTLISYGDAEKEMNTYRAKVGYDGFEYACIRPDGGLWFFDGKAYCKDENGAFSAALSARSFREYLDGYYAPVGLLASQYLQNVKRDGMKVEYELNEKGRGLFTRLVKGFSPEKILVTVKIGERGLVEEETFRMKGTLQGEETEVNMNTRLLEYRGESIFDLAGITKPVETEFASVSDIRIPFLMVDAAEQLAARENISFTLFHSYLAKVGETSYIDYEEHKLSQKSPSEFYHSLRFTTRIPTGEGDTWVQRRIKKDGASEVTYDMKTGVLLSETGNCDLASPWPEMLEGGLTSVSALADAVLETGTEDDTVTFSMHEDACREYAKKKEAFFRTCGVDLSAFALESCTGTFTVSKESGELCALSLLFSGTAGGANVSVQLSLTVDAGEVTQPDEITAPSQGDSIPSEH